MSSKLDSYKVLIDAVDAAAAHGGESPAAPDGVAGKSGCAGIPRLAVAFARNPKLAEAVREAGRKDYGEIVPAGAGFEKSAVLALAADGLLLWEFLGVSPFTDEQCSRILDELSELARGGTW